MPAPGVSAVWVQHPVPVWMDDALCRRHDPALWFPNKGYSRAARDARAICAECPVQPDCLAYGASLRLRGPLHGIWGGRTFQHRHDAEHVLGVR